MSWFFNQWVYGSEFPKMTVQYSLTPNEKGAQLSGTIAQRGVSKGFRSILPFTVFIGKGGGSGKLVAEGESSKFSVQLPKLPDRVEFNSLHGTLCDIEVKKL
jgi:hypothetical protein